MMRAQVLVAALALVAATGCERSTARAGPDVAVTHPEANAPFAGRAYAGDVDRGRLIFATNCATCHGANGKPGGVGPSLIDENKRQDLSRTIVWIENPDAPMPKLYPSPLTERDVEDVAAFVQNIR